MDNSKRWAVVATATTVIALAAIAVTGLILRWQTSYLKEFGLVMTLDRWTGNLSFYGWSGDLELYSVTSNGAYPAFQDTVPVDDKDAPEGYTAVPPAASAAQPPVDDEQPAFEDAVPLDDEEGWEPIPSRVRK